MFKYFRDYYWKAGKPYGREIIDPACEPVSYKIVVDPYYKRFSIEKYHTGHFDKVVYDSLLLDFRHLTQEHQLAWQREVLSEDNQQSICLLRNQEDRVILKEILCFEDHYCRSCQTHSVHGLPLAIHRMYYKSLQDPFDGVVLYDGEARPVMMKTYETDPITSEFTTLLNEEWNMQNRPALLP